MQQALAPESLYALVADLDPVSHLADPRTRLLSLVGDQWGAMEARDPNPYDAETCRLTMLAAAKGGDFSAVRLWRVRALARFVAVEWLSGVGMVLMSLAFSELAIANSDYSGGKTLDVLAGSQAALDILEEVERFTVGQGSEPQLMSGSPSRDVLRRLFHEKKAFLLLLDHQYEGSRRSYQAAQAAATTSRGKIKVQLGAILVDLLDPATTTSPLALAAATEDLGRQASAIDSADVGETAMRNARLIRSSRRDVSPYEIL